MARVVLAEGEGAADSGVDEGAVVSMGVVVAAEADGRMSIFFLKENRMMNVIFTLH